MGPAIVLCREVVLLEVILYSVGISTDMGVLHSACPLSEVPLNYLEEGVGVSPGQQLAVAGGDTLHAHAPSIVVHERTLHKVHVDGEVLPLVATEGFQGGAPVIVDLVNVLALQVLERREFCLGGEEHVGVVVMHPLSPLARQPPHLNIVDTNVFLTKIHQSPEDILKWSQILH